MPDDPDVRQLTSRIVYEYPWMTLTEDPLAALALLDRHQRIRPPRATE